MTQIGVFARVFAAGSANSASRLAAAIAGAGFTTSQLNLAAIGRPTLDAELDRATAEGIRAAFTGAGVGVWGVSGTFNAIHPDARMRQQMMAACCVLIAQVRSIGADVVTLCTGTRDPEDMWRVHPANTSIDAWRDLRGTLDVLLAAADASGVRLGIEPEAGNVICDAAAADRLMSELGADARLVTIVLDPANLVTLDTLDQQRSILERAFDLLGDRVGAIHAKDVGPDGPCAAGRGGSGTGGLDYGLIMRLHARLAGDVPVIAQDLAAEEAPVVCAFLRQAAAQARG
ncbi:MAG: sugar phosphate isomerase/epimerase [Actinomycetales bacterium]|nr:sugar phosphate isomerase/epimerase [Actinomycetales bacterium]